MKHLIKYFLHFILFFIFIACAHQRLEKSEDTTTFAKNNLRNSHYKNFIFNSDSEYYVFKPEWGKKALKHTPLTLTYNKQDFIFFGTKDGSFNCVNLKNNQLIFSTKIEGVMTSTPVIDPATKRIYLVSRDMNDFKLFALDIKGKVIAKEVINLKEILAQKGIDSNQIDLTYYAQRTALGLNKINSRPYIFFAFTNAKGSFYLGQHSANSFYNTSRGASGIVLGYYLDNSKGLSKDPPLIFFTSHPVRDQSFSGNNSGVYLSGGGITLLPQNELIIATGNGQFQPEAKQYGCSLLKLKGHNFEIIKNRHKPVVFSNEKAGYQECYFNESEMSSSYPVTIDTKKGARGLIVDKSGSLHILSSDFYHNSTEQKIMSFKIDEIFKHSSTAHYSGDLIFEKNNKVYALIKSNNTLPESKKISIYADSKERLPAFYQDYDKKKCLGLIGKDKSEKSKKISLFYSGPTLNRYLIGEENWLEKLTDGNYEYLLKMTKSKASHTVSNWSLPYKKFSPVGYSVTKLQKAPQGYQRERFDLFAIKTHKTNRLHSIYTTPRYKEINNEYVYSSKLTKPAFTYFKAQNKTQQCQGYDNKSFKPLFEYSFDPKELNTTYTLALIDITQPQSLKILKKRQGDQFEYTNKSPLILIQDQNKKQLAIYSATHKKTQKSKLYILDLEKLNIIREVAIGGPLHFSHIVPYKEHLIYATKDNGIEVFSNRPPSQ
ncbi:MAG: hypothetical protein CME62_03990 [Halobacteriovoraceae bacterium]|nr:hypothetical protein [Halobacteriovoraceae bacterium]|tara:strand:- start:21435 stop:23579 length:2145 start_codon:yes stop_codon:yes gene_type:complete